MTKQQRDNIDKLIRKIAERTSTEGLIAFVAANFGMLPACRKVLDLLATPDSAESEWLQEQCHNCHINSQLLQSESQRILAIFQPELSYNEQYSLLGLTPEATIDEVKSAFRKLSFRYHPDSAVNKNLNDNEKFIAICRAYKKIMGTDETQTSTLNNSASTPWNHNYKPKKPSKQKRKTIFLIAAITIALLFISLSATRSYRKKAMLKSLGHTKKIAIVNTPQPETVTVARAIETIRPPIKPVAPKAIPATPKPEKTTRPIDRPIVKNIPVPKETIKSTPLPSPPKPSTVVKNQTPMTPPAPEPIKVVAVNSPQPKPLASDPLRTVPPAETTPVAPPLQNRIDTFLASYTNAYELLNFAAFAAFFTADAKENGVPFKEKFSQYHKLFDKLKDISYKVTPRSWQTYNEFIYLSCRFHAYFLYNNGEEVNLRGPTSFQLHEDQDHNLKVKNLTYTFD